MIPALRSRPDLWRFVKFLFVGVLNTAFGFVVYAALLWVGLDPQPALAISYVVGVIWNYFTHARIVFKSEGFRRMPQYAAAYTFLYVINATALALLLKAGLPPLAAQAVLLLPQAMMAFILVSKVLTGSVPFLSGRGRSG